MLYRGPATRHPRPLYQLFASFSSGPPPASLGGVYYGRWAAHREASLQHPTQPLDREKLAVLHVRNPTCQKMALPHGLLKPEFPPSGS